MQLNEAIATKKLQKMFPLFTKLKTNEVERKRRSREYI